VRQGKISGVGRTLRELVFNDYNQEFVAKHVVEESTTLEKDMVTNPNGVGITGISSARKLQREGIAKILARGQIRPTRTSRTEIVCCTVRCTWPPTSRIMIRRSRNSSIS